MGYDLHRFEGDVDEELLCPICSSVLEEPVQAPQCEHAFCNEGIQEWLSRQENCPVDRNPITSSQLKAVPRILRNLLARLTINCDNAAFGCSAQLKLDTLNAHVMECEFNPKKPVRCEKGCGLSVPKDEVEVHNCVKELRSLVTRQQQKMDVLSTEIMEVKLSNAEMKRELQMLKDYMRAMRAANPRLRELHEEIDNDEITRWVRTLQPARVTRWGGMISTPDTVLQSVIKRALIENGCPAQIVNELMENAHERRWPPGLSTLETRQHNRRLYENYVTKRIPGKQAVVMMACENGHMAENMVLHPGLVMIFAHGVE